MAPLSIRDVKKSFGATRILHGVSIDIDDGEFVTLVGPSGCGKSTLLRMIAGLETISDGEIHLDGRVVNHLQPKERDVAMVFQNYALYPHMSVAQNMGFALKLAGMPKGEIRARVDRAAGILGLTDLVRRTPRELSGGQRQRVAMGRAIVRDPKVFLFDEPLSNLDAKLRVQMRAEIKELHQTLRTTTVYVTHDQIEAMTMADRIVVMNAGLVEQIGAPLELYDRPANLFVAGFIGSPGMNLLPGRTERGMFRADAGFALPLPPGAPAVDGDRCIYGFRPEHVLPGEEAVEGHVVVVEPTGSESLVVLRIGSAQITCVFRERIAATPGTALSVGPDLSAVHLFDEATGRRLPDGSAMASLPSSPGRRPSLGATA